MDGPSLIVGAVAFSPFLVMFGVVIGYQLGRHARGRQDDG